MGWLSKAKASFNKVLGKAKEGAETMGRMYDKGKEIYSKGKEIVSSIPIVGDIASKYIAEKEGMVGKKLESITGMSPAQMDVKQKSIRGMIEKASYV